MTIPKTDIYSTPTTAHPPATFPRVVLAHGGGGQLTDVLINELILPRFTNPALTDLLDSGITKDGNLALTIDSYVVQPLFFPGADIGRLAVSGTVNDLAVSGATPLGLAFSMILAEGLPRQILERVLDSVAATADEAGVRVITGDTKVVGRGQADGLYLTTAGVGKMEPGPRPHPNRVASGDVLLINGPIGEHGLAVMLAREMPEVQSVLRSDAAPLNGLIAHLRAAVPGVLFMRDPTRGGLAGVVADLATRTGHRIILEEKCIPIRREARHAADMLGLDPLDIANEGKVLVVVRPAEAQAA
ncbi:MAG: hydrogenase expression/formation protein HypE, partial [Phycisphaerae bacterium]|nr:hydrogenase expression/formation protein HypE [Phycisphaerae bacterium]